ncbi:MAG: DUF4384 domain-containing protein [Acidobacteria bacterium]|nr:DUF4384 domain-containing protein [Acidobacteriota bacterium]
MTNFRLNSFSALCLMISIFGGAVIANAAPQEAQTRKLWDSQFFKAKKPATGKATTPRRRYRVVTPQISPDRVNGDTVLGITLWRLRPASAKDDKEVRLFKHSKDDTKVVQWTPERISVDTPLAIGQRVRLSIESARTGYLYVINRELYADGSMGEPYLIFPTTRLRGGENKVTLGRIVDIPAQEDSPNYFNLDPDRADLVGESLSVLITPEPLPGVKIGEDAIQLPRAEVAEWEKKWASRVGRLEMENSVGKAWTKEEKEASAAGGKQLKAGSPAPQTVYYRPDAKATDPMMISVKLHYGKAKSASK